MAKEEAYEVEGNCCSGPGKHSFQSSTWKRATKSLRTSQAECENTLFVSFLVTKFAWNCLPMT